MSWVEFAEYGKKTERYTRAVVEIKNLKSRWTCLMEAERAAPAQIAYLVQEGQSFPMRESRGYQRPATRMTGINLQLIAVLALAAAGMAAL